MMPEEDKEHCRIFDNCRFCEKNFESDMVRDHCHPTAKYKGPAHRKNHINVTQKKNTFIPSVFYNFTNYDCHLFSKKLVDEKTDQPNLLMNLRQTKNTYQ